MTKNNDLKNIVLDAIMEFYLEYIKPETRQMVEEVLDEKLDQKLDEKLDEKLGPIKAAIITLEKSVSVALGDYKGQQIQVSDHEKRITTLESKVIHSA